MFTNEKAKIYQLIDVVSALSIYPHYSLERMTEMLIDANIDPDIHYICSKVLETLHDLHDFDE